MDTLNAHLDKMMLQACLDATAAQQNLAPAQKMPAPAPASKPIVLAKPQPFDGTRGTAAEVFVGQIGLHAITYPKNFPTDAIKVMFAVLFMKDYTATLSQLYLDKVFNREPVVFNDFLNDFKSSFFDHTCQHRSKGPCGTSARLEPCQHAGL
ncbi:uncharacterized protein VP01_1973g2 [Puccinia sorghi]|uniref:Retrotransposon gag domain-containing protein n=1 Tax=Puccinia sorghi TaxID=27349 RepID=A0A0L6VCB0_9BASI|nr:uncharacterized protein VP01_1973g2 [Puccinia sorghi]